MQQLGVSYSGADLPWYLVPVNFLFMNLRSLAIWTLFFVFAVLFFAVKMLYIKKAMVQRSLGLFDRDFKRSLWLDATILLGAGSFSWLLFVLWQGSLSNVYVKTFSILSCLIFLVSIWTRWLQFYFPLFLCDFTF